MTKSASVFTAEHDALREAVRAMLADHSAPVHLPSSPADHSDGESRIRKLMAEMGLFGLAVPEAYGGAGYGWVEVAIVLEETGRALAYSPYYSTALLSVATLLEMNDTHAAADYLPRLAAGTLSVTLACTEADGQWDPTVVTLTARRAADDSWVLDGRKSYVLDGVGADLLLVTARSAQGLGLFAVEVPAAGVSVTALETLDLTRGLARIDFDGVPARPIGAIGAVEAVLTRVLDLAVVGLAAEQVGGAQRALEMAVEYAKTRYQFGRPIGSFQAIKHACADMLVAVELAKSAAYHAAWAADSDTEELPIAASLAKACCSDAYFEVAAKNIQIHGGIGFTWEHPAHLYFKRASSNRLLWGDPTYHRELLARQLHIQ